MRFLPAFISCFLLLIWLLLPYASFLNRADSLAYQDAGRSTTGVRQKFSTRSPVVTAATGVSEKERQLAEREVALKLKEQELNRLSAKLDARMREFSAARKSMETTLSTRKKADNERYRKMLKLYKAMRPEEAAGLIDKLDEDIAIELLNQMDTKTAAKLIPLLDRKRVLKWTRASLKGY